MGAVEMDIRDQAAATSSTEGDARSSTEGDASQSAAVHPLGWFSHPATVFVGPALALVGLVLLVVGYVGVSRREIDALQLPYLVSGGLGGLFALGLGMGFAAVRELRMSNERVVALDRKVSMLGEALEDVLDDLAIFKDAQRGGR